MNQRFGKGHEGKPHHHFYWRPAWAKKNSLSVPTVRHGGFAFGHSLGDASDVADSVNGGFSRVIVPGESIKICRVQKKWLAASWVVAPVKLFTHMLK